MEGGREDVVIIDGVILAQDLVDAVQQLRVSFLLVCGLCTDALPHEVEYLGVDSTNMNMDVTGFGR